MRDRGFRLGTAIPALAVPAVVAGIGLVLAWGSSLSIRAFGLGFWSGRTWDPVSGEFGALPFLWGTLYSSFLALLLATPVALGIAIFLSEVAPRRARRPLIFLTELLAAVPSIVYGLWGIFVLVPLVRAFTLRLPPWLRRSPLFDGPPVGIGMLAAAMVLAIMVVPFTASVAREVLKAVPASQREAALALGATRWEAIRVALHYGRTGVLGAVVLGLGRALGETMAVTMVIGNSPTIALSLLKPQYTMAAVIANEFTEAADELYLHALMEIGLVLFIVTVAINALSRLLIWSVGREPRPARRRPAPAVLETA
jgi:phosphate transport system permease protein